MYKCGNKYQRVPVILQRSKREFFVFNSRLMFYIYIYIEHYCPLLNVVSLIHHIHVRLKVCLKAQGTN